MYPDDIPTQLLPRAEGEPLTREERSPLKLGKGYEDLMKTWKIATPEGLRKYKQNPEPSETVTFTGHIRNHGSVRAGAFSYAWLLDGKPVGGSQCKGLDPEEEMTAEQKWQWLAGPHTVGLHIQGKPYDEISTENNALTDRTDAWCFLIILDSEEERKKAWDPHPQGVQGYDGAWWFAESIPWAEAVCKIYDWGLIHELMHQLSLIDNYHLNSGGKARDEQGNIVKLSHTMRQAGVNALLLLRISMGNHTEFHWMEIPVQSRGRVQAPLQHERPGCGSRTPVQAPEEAPCERDGGRGPASPWPQHLIPRHRGGRRRARERLLQRGPRHRLGRRPSGGH
jgi:hypothetical protein